MQLRRNAPRSSTPAAASRHIAGHHALAATAFLTLLPISRAFATTFTWTDGDGTGVWNDALNWSPTGLPANNDTVQILGGPSLPVGAGWSVDFSNATPVSLAALTVSHSNNLLSSASNSLTLPSVLSNLTVMNEYVGDSSSGGTRGFGVFTLNADATNTAQNLTLGRNISDAGTYNLNSGTLNADNVIAGASGSGTINQSGVFQMQGPATPTLILGDAAGAAGTYNLQGYLNNYSGTEIIGNNGTGTFTQSAGANEPGNASLTSTIILANSPGSTGTYNLTDGSVIVTNLTLGPGNASFNQSGGTVTLNSASSGNFHYVPYLTVGKNGNGTYTLGTQASLVNFGGYEFIGSGTGSNGTFIQNGGSNVFTGASGTVPELRIGDYNAGNGTYILNDGLLSAIDSYEEIGLAQSGTFTQNGGTNRAYFISIGGQQGSNTTALGTYSLSNGSLEAGYIDVGLLGATGTFMQSGGNVTLSDPAGTPQLVLSFSYSGSATGSYSLSGNASLTVNNNGEEIIGDSTGTAFFTQSGGTNSLNASNTGMAQLVLAKTAGGSGNYTLSAGDLTVNGTESVGYAGHGNFSQSGGNNTVLSGYLILGNTTNSVGNYTLSGGNLSAPNIGIALPGASASFTQTGGNVTVGSLGIANNASNATGSYSLSNGSMMLVGYPTAAYVYIAGSGNGSFTQSGGAIAPAAGIDASLYVGYSGSAIGAYSLSNGSITLPLGREYVGCFGTGTFTQSGGQNTLTGTAFLAIGGFAGAHGTYLLSGGALSVNNNIYVGGSASGPGGVGALAISNAGTLTSAGTLTAFNTANTTITLTGGSLTTAAFHDDASYSQSGGTASLGPITGNGSISISNGLATASSFHLHYLFLANTGFLQLSPATANATASTLDTLLFAGSPGHWSGTLDLANNALILQPTALTKAAALSNLQDQLATGAITGSTLPANVRLTLLDNAITNFTAFGNQSVDGNSLLVAPLLLGDANADGTVNGNDLQILLDHFGQAATAWTSGDFTGDPTIDLSDLSWVLNNMNLTYNTFTGAISAASAPVPEPASLTLFLGAAALLARARRRARR